MAHAVPVVCADEKRVAWDTLSYTKLEFLSWYGQLAGWRCWSEADPRFMMVALLQQSAILEQHDAEEERKIAIMQKFEARHYKMVEQIEGMKKQLLELER
eukprot:5919073-Karenia_brevis.AAC.1